jgi:3-oxoacyl-[acyl-carrier protein] reductase
VLLDGKNAVIYGGAGTIGSAVATIFAREGATVHLTGRTKATLEDVVSRIHADGGRAEAAVVDAFDEVEVDEHVDIVAACSGSVDISFNLVAIDEALNLPLADMQVADFERPIVDALRTQFITARAAARHMICQESGVILTLGNLGGGDPVHGFRVASGAIDVLRLRLAEELRPKGIRVLTIESAGDADADDVANIAAFAASDLARSMTGTSLDVTHGRVT